MAAIGSVEGIMVASTDRQQHSRLLARISWVQCQHELREMQDGWVPCPIGGLAMAADCLDCHLLETVAGERDPRVSCATPED